MRLDHYMKEGFKVVEGWCNPIVADVIKVFYTKTFAQFPYFYN